MVSPSPSGEDDRERIERRLRQEYARTRVALEDLVHDNLDAPYRLSGILFQGAENTRTSFLAHLCAPYLAASTPGLRGIMQTSQQLTSLLTPFECFADVQASLERSANMLSDEGDVDLVLRVREASRVYLNVGTEVGNSEGSATGRVRLRHLFGGDEKLEAAVAYGTTTRSNVQARFDTPIPGRPSPATRLEISASTIEEDLTHFASCKQQSRSAAVKLRTLTSLGSHEFAYELADRHLTDFQPYASLSMRRSAGHTVKSALVHSFSMMDALGARRIKLNQEYAGLGGDAHHWKLSCDGSMSQAILGRYTITSSLRGGLLLPLNGKASLFSDRFQLGGPTSVRSFKINGIGPKDSGDSLGGDLYWSAGLSLFAPIPRRLLAWNAGRSVAEHTRDMLKHPVGSVGIGLAYSPAPNVRLEANFALPVLASATDATRKGLAVGWGVSCL